MSNLTTLDVVVVDDFENVKHSNSRLPEDRTGSQNENVGEKRGEARYIWCLGW